MSGPYFEWLSTHPKPIPLGLFPYFFLSSVSVRGVSSLSAVCSVTSVHSSLTVPSCDICCLHFCPRVPVGSAPSSLSDFRWPRESDPSAQPLPEPPRPRVGSRESVYRVKILLPHPFLQVAFQMLLNRVVAFLGSCPSFSSALQPLIRSSHTSHSFVKRQGGCVWASLSPQALGAGGFLQFSWDWTVFLGLDAAAGLRCGWSGRRPELPPRLQGPRRRPPPLPASARQRGPVHPRTG